MAIVGIDRRGQDDEIRVSHPLLRVYDVAIDCTQFDGGLEILNTSPNSDDAGGQALPTKDHAERPADQPHPDNCRLIEMQRHNLSSRTDSVSMEN